MRKTLAITGGWIIVVLGILVSPLPGPLGTPVIAGGLLIVLTHSVWARRRFVLLERRYPRVVGPMRRLLKGWRGGRKKPGNGNGNGNGTDGTGGDRTGGPAGTLSDR